MKINFNYVIGWSIVFSTLASIFAILGLMIGFKLAASIVLAAGATAGIVVGGTLIGMRSS